MSKIDFIGESSFNPSNENRLKMLETRSRFISLAHEIIKNKITQAKFKEVDFVDDSSTNFSTEVVNKDLKTITDLKKSMRSLDVSKYGERGADLMKKVSEIFEYIIYHQVRNNSWLNQSSEKFTAYLASDFDDIINGVDIVLEKKNREDEKDNQNVYGVSIDVTYGSTEQTIQAKYKKIEDRIYKANPNQKNPKPLPGIKYFKSDFNGYQGPVENVANLVVGASHEHILDLFSSVFKDELPLIYNENNSDYKQAQPHPCNLMMLEQIWAQASYLKCVAAFNNNPDLRKKYLRISGVAYVSFSNMIKKVDSPELIKKYFAEDDSHQMIIKTIEQKLDLLFVYDPGTNGDLYGVKEKPEIRLLP